MMEPVCIRVQVPSHMLLAIKDGVGILAIFQGLALVLAVDC